MALGSKTGQATRVDVERSSLLRRLFASHTQSRMSNVCAFPGNPCMPVSLRLSAVPPKVALRPFARSPTGCQASSLNHQAVGETPEATLECGEGDGGGECIRGVLKILGQGSVSSEPGKGSFGDPALRQGDWPRLGATLQQRSELHDGGPARKLHISYLTEKESEHHAAVSLAGSSFP